MHQALVPNALYGLHHLNSQTTWNSERGSDLSKVTELSRGRVKIQPLLAWSQADPGLLPPLGRSTWPSEEQPPEEGDSCGTPGKSRGLVQQGSEKPGLGPALPWLARFLRDPLSFGVLIYKMGWNCLWKGQWKKKKVSLGVCILDSFLAPFFLWWLSGSRQISKPLNVENDFHLKGLLWGLKTICVKNLGQSLACSSCSINVFHY